MLSTFILASIGASQVTLLYPDITWNLANKSLELLQEPNGIQSYSVTNGIKVRGQK